MSKIHFQLCDTLAPTSDLDDHLKALYYVVVI